MFDLSILSKEENLYVEKNEAKYPFIKKNQTKGSRKKRYFFSGPATKALELSGHKKISRIIF